MKTLRFVTFALTAVCTVVAIVGAVTIYSKKYKKSYITVCE